MAKRHCALSVRPPSRNRLLARMLEQLVLALDEFRLSGFSSFKTAWREHHVLQGKSVQVLFADGTSVEATVKDIADDGTLIVTRGGKELYVTAGEISLRAATKKAKT